VLEALQEMILKFEGMTGCHIGDLWTNGSAEFRSISFFYGWNEKILSLTAVRPIP